MSKHFNRLNVNFSKALVNCNPLKDGLQNSISFINKPSFRNLKDKQRPYIVQLKAQTKSSEKNKLNLCKKVKFFFYFLLGVITINNLDSKGSFSSHIKLLQGYPELPKGGNISQPEQYNPATFQSKQKACCTIISFPLKKKCSKILI